MSTPVRWIEVRVLVPDGWHELVAEAITRGPCTTVVFGRPSLATDEAPSGFDYVRTFIPTHADSPELRRELAFAVGDLARSTGALELSSLALQFRELPPEDYATSWKKSWKPFRIGRLCVLAPWSSRTSGAQPRANDLTMILEPGGAFGSGRHATTRMMMRVVEERLKPGSRVADAGSGSGILAVAAALHGASEVFGFDTDPNALPYARVLAEVNGVDARCRFAAGDFELLKAEPRAFDVVLANIYTDIVQAHARDMKQALAPGGWFAFSGCPEHGAQATREAITQAGLAIEEDRVRGRWHTFVGTHAG